MERALPFHRCEVREVRRIAPDLVKVSLDPGPDYRAAWLDVPGGFVTFNLPLTPRLERSYSLVSAPHDPYPRIAVKELPGGRGSAFFNRALRPGMTLDVLPPRTRLYEPWMDNSPRHWVLFGAGIGVTPLLGLARHALAAHPHNRVSLFLGNRSLKSIPLYDACNHLAANERAEVRYVFSDGSSAESLFNGRIDALKTPDLLQDAHTHFPQHPPMEMLGFVSGPGDMPESVRQGWTSAALPLHHLRAERFHFPPGKSGPTEAAPSSTITFRRGQEVWSVHMHSGTETLLSAAIRAGVPVNHQCRGGVCGTCKATMISGEVKSDKPLGGDQILCCQSRPVSRDIEVKLG